jgi:hypothetical protein
MNVRSNNSPNSESERGREPKSLAPAGIQVPDRPGFIRSPLAPDAGLIDVRGMPSGTEIVDPYSGQTIRIP